MAEQLKSENDVEVQLVKGRFLELSVDIDGQKVIATNRLWYPPPSSVVKRTRKFLKKELR